MQTTLSLRLFHLFGHLVHGRVYQSPEARQRAILALTSSDQFQTIHRDAALTGKPRGVNQA